MGRAARANPRVAIKATLTDGPQNPAKNRIVRRLMAPDAEEIRKIRAEGQMAIMQVRDRSYFIDPRGFYRRIRMPAATKERTANA